MLASTQPKDFWNNYNNNRMVFLFILCLTIVSLTLKSDCKYVQPFALGLYGGSHGVFQSHHPTQIFRVWMSATWDHYETTAAGQ